MEAPVKRKIITAKLHPSNGGPSSPRPPSRNGRLSPSKPWMGSPLPSTSTLSPAFRPKAKVNSTATVARKPPTVNGSSVTPRANTPSGRPTAPSSAPKSIKARATTTVGIRPPLKPQLNPSLNTPVLQQQPLYRASPGNLSDTGLPSPGRTRHGSLSLHHAASYSSLHSRSTSGPNIIPEDGSSLGPRFKSKVSATAGLSPSLSASSSPPYAKQHARIRSPSIGTPSSAPFSLPTSPAHETYQQQLFYPITSATSAANPHRYAVPRPPPPNQYHHNAYQPFVEPILSPGRGEPQRGPFDFAVTPKVDPTSIPLPAHSPPNSAVSFSSRSSLSRSSMSYNTDTSGGHTSSLRSGLDSLGLNILPPSATLGDVIGEGDLDEDEGDLSDDTDSEDANGPERQIRLEAKSMRKIEDLEITNRSLLTINALLESTKNRQAKEIRDLKRKLRESRLILPPRAFRAVKEKEEVLDEHALSDEDEDEEEDEELVKGDRPADEVYSRVKGILDTLITSGKRALETRPDDFKESPKGGKVLTAEEVANWRGGSGVIGLGLEGMDDGDTTMDMSIDMDASQVAVPESDDEFLSEEEVEAALFEPDFFPRAISPRPGAVPPIRISLSP